MRELEKLLYDHKRCAQQAGISQQRAVTLEKLGLDPQGERERVTTCLDKAEEARSKILEWVRRNLPTFQVSDPTATTTHPNVYPLEESKQ